MVRTLASHQCGPDSNLGSDVISEFAAGDFYAVLQFLLPPQNQLSKFQFDLETLDKEPGLRGIPIYLFIF